MKVVLLIPPGGYHAQRWRHKVLPPPLGLAYLGTVLVNNGIEVEIVDAHLQKLSWRALAQKLRSARPDIVGVSFTTETRFRGFRAIALAKQAVPQAVTVAGGPHVSLAAEDTLKHLAALDVIVRGEGEYSLLELSRAISRGDDLRSVAGISFRRGGRIVHNPPRPPIKDLDRIPAPDRRLLRWREYNFLLDVPAKGKRPAATLITSRGCPFGCVFCASSALWGRNVRMASPRKVVEELKHLVESYGVRAFWFLDDTFTVDRGRVQQICDLILEEGLEIDWFCEARVDTLDEKLLRRMRQAGCCRVGFGVESGSERVLSRHVAKPVELEKVRRLASCCRRLGIVAHPFFILSLPGETYDDARRTFSLFHELERDHQPSLSLLHIYPGTRLEKMARQTGVLPEWFTWTRRRIPRVLTLPALQGDVPIFLDRLTLAEIGEFLLEWAESPAATDEALSRSSGRGHPLSSALIRILASIRSIQDLRPYLPMLRPFLRRRIGAKISGPGFARSSATASKRKAKKPAWLPSLVRVYRSFALRREERCCHPPIRLWIELTNACDLRCIMCPQSRVTDMPTGRMRFDLFKEIIEEAKDFVHDAALHHRGESLLHPELHRMIAYAAERGIQTKLHTNAVRLDEERSRNLLDSGLDLLSFSFDGYTKEAYERIRVGADFEQVVRNIIAFLEMKRRLGRQKPFTMIEMIDLPGIGLGGERSQRRRFEERFRNLPLDRIAVKKPHNWAGMHTFSRQEGPPPKKLTRCLFPWFALVVLWDGEVLPCPQDFLAELSIGNVNESSLMEIWNGERMVRLRRGLLRGDFLRLAPCRDCDMLQRRRLLGIPLSASQAVLRRARRASR